MRSRLSRLHYVLHELRRRHVVRVVGVYVFCAWIVLQVCAIVFPPLLVPDWVLTVMVVLVLVGLPLVGVLTWMYDITPRGVVRTQPARNAPVESVRFNWHHVDLVIILALLSALTFVLLRSGESVETQELRSVAVLPFADLSVDHDNAYFSDGLSEALIDSLARIEDLRVLSRTSSFALRDQSSDLSTIAARLGVDSILEGSVRKSGNRIRVSARLVDARHGHNLWNDTYDATLDDIFQVQDHIARSIAEVFQVRLLGDQPLVEVATDSDTAYDHYLRGRARLRSEGTLANLEAAIVHFEQAIALDRRFALARAGLCTAHWQRYESTRDAELVPQALEVCEQAEIHDDQRAETHVALGNILAGTGQYERAQAVFNRALEIEASRSDAHLGLGHLMEKTGRHAEAEAHYQRAIELDPAYWRNYSFYSAFLAGRGRLEEAIEKISTGIRLEPDSPRLYSNLGAFYLHAGDYNRAAEAFEKSIAREPTGRAYSNAGTAYFLVGDFEMAEEMLRQALDTTPADYRLMTNLAEAIAVQEGREEEAMEYYQAAIELARQRLEVNPSDHDCRATLALNLVKAGKPGLAHDELVYLQQHENLGAEANRKLGEVAFLLDDLELAIDLLGQAMALGLSPVRHTNHNPALEPLYNHPEYLSMIEQQRD